MLLKIQVIIPHTPFVHVHIPPAHIPPLLRQYIVSGVVPSTPNFTKAWRAIELKAALKNVCLLEGHWDEEVARSDWVNTLKADLTLGKEALKGLAALLGMEDDSLAPKIK